MHCFLHVTTSFVQKPFHLSCILQVQIPGNLLFKTTEDSPKQPAFADFKSILSQWFPFHYSMLRLHLIAEATQTASSLYANWASRWHSGLRYHTNFLEIFSKALKMHLKLFRYPSSIIPVKYFWKIQLSLMSAPAERRKPAFGKKWGEIENFRFSSMVNREVVIMKNGYNSKYWGPWEVWNYLFWWHPLLLIFLTFERGFALLLRPSCRLNISKP